MLYRFAVAAVSVGSFSFSHAVGIFACIVVGEVLWGLGGRLGDAAPAPLGARSAHRDHPLGVDAVRRLLAARTSRRLGRARDHPPGLYISWNGFRLISAATRLQGIFFWDFLIYVIEGMIFLLTGLQARTLISASAGYSWRELVVSAAVTSLVVIAARFVWMYPSHLIPRWHSLDQTQGSGAALAVAFRSGLHRCARDGFARGGARHPIRDENGHPFPIAT